MNIEKNKNTYTKNKTCILESGQTEHENIYIQTTHSFHLMRKTRGPNSETFRPVGAKRARKNFIKWNSEF